MKNTARGRPGYSALGMRNTGHLRVVLAAEDEAQKLRIREFGIGG